MAKNLLEETLDAWGYARDGVIDELENIPATDYNFRPSPHSRSAAELAAHIIESGLMASGELTRKDENSSGSRTRSSSTGTRAIGRRRRRRPSS